MTWSQSCAKICNNGAMASLEGRTTKRQKLSNDPQHPDGDIRGAFELHNLLQFKQSGEPEVKTGIERFRKFLVDIAKENDRNEKAVLLKVLKQYCDDQSSSSKNQVDFADLLSTWSFAAQSNADSITAAVPAVLAQFFRTISNELDFRDFGTSLCHSLLKTDQVRLLDRGLAAPKHKDFMISPCLRLVTEMMSFDAGSMAANVFSRRDNLLKRLDILLDPISRDRSEPDRRRPTVRRNAQRLLLAMLRYLDTEARSELISQGKVLYSCVRNLASDGGDIIRDILKTFRLSLLSPDLQRLTKTRFLNTANLQLFAQLYDFAEEEVDAGNGLPSVRQAAHDFLVTACTSQSGALLPQPGWYPSDYKIEEFLDDEDDSGIDLGLESPYHSDNYATGVPVKNTNLAIFLQKLSPESDVLHAELMLKIFEAAPELVADYFSKRSKSLGGPTDDNAWVGMFGFLYSVVEMPIPANVGHGDRLPFISPPNSVIIESLLPRPLDRTSLTAFIKKEDDLALISACRVVTVALQKLQKVLKYFSAGATRRELWAQASSKLARVMSERVPNYNDIVTAFQKTAKDAHDARGTVLECMAMYKQVLPQATAMSAFDIGLALVDLLQVLRLPDLDDGRRGALEKQELALISIAGLSRGTKWWHKHAEQLCPMMQVLLSLGKSSEVICTAIRDAIRPVLIEKGILLASESSWTAIATAFSDSSLQDDQSLLDFIENCLIRTMKQPVKYLELLEAAQSRISDSTPLSLIICTISEQWPYMLQKDDLSSIAGFVSKLFALLGQAEGNVAVLDDFRNAMLKAAESHKEHHKTLKKAFKRQKQSPTSLEAQQKPLGPIDIISEEPSAGPSTSQANPFDPAAPMPTSITTLPPTYDIESDLSANPSTSRLATLIHSLSSTSSEIRLNALTTLSNLLPSLLKSTYTEAIQIHLLLGELLETARQHSISNPTTPHLPCTITSLTLFYLTSLTNPSDPLYPQINHFLLRAPTWLPFTKVLPYWTTHLLLGEADSLGTSIPNQDSTNNPNPNDAALLSFLASLANGLAFPEDTALLRRANFFERLCSLYLRAGCNRMIRKAVLRVLWCTAGVEGGADTLITRVGVRAWLDAVEEREVGGEMKGLVREVRRKVEEGCDADYIARWERGIRSAGGEGGEGKGDAGKIGLGLVA